MIHSTGYGAKGTKEDKDKLAVDYFTPLANEEYAPAQSDLGVMYRNGRGVQKDYAEAARLFQLAADQGYARAQSNLGFMYRYGYGVQKDHAQAVRLFQLAADQGYAPAQNNLGWMYQKRHSVQQNDTKAAWYYQQAANQGLTSAQDNLKALYLEGRGKVSPATEQVYFTAMEELGVPKNVYLFQLGIRYLNNNGVDRQSHTQARKNLEKAKELGHPSATFYLGESYREGGEWLGMLQGSAKAKENYIKAAQSGDKQIEAKAALNRFYPEVIITHLTSAPPRFNPNPTGFSLYEEL